MASAVSERFHGDHHVKVLDMACGTGALSRRLGERGFCVTGLDFSLKSLDLLNQATRNIPLIQADAAALPLASSSFDVVTCMGAWRHFPEPQRVVDEVRRVLRPNGIFLVGYFPPRLAGIFSAPSGPLGRAVAVFYGRIMRLLNYNDRTGQELEREILRMIDVAFEKYHLIRSHELEYLIFAESPRYNLG